MSPRAHGRAIQLVTVWSGSTPEGGNNKIDDKSSRIYKLATCIARRLKIVIYIYLRNLINFFC